MQLKNHASFNQIILKITAAVILSISLFSLSGCYYSKIDPITGEPVPITEQEYREYKRVDRAN